jgi:tryptophan synthase beta chain
MEQDGKRILASATVKLSPKLKSLTKEKIMHRTKYMLSEDEIPRFYYNLRADLPSAPPPVLHPGTMQPVGPDDLAPLFPLSLIEQEVTTEREVKIPEEVLSVYTLYRPTPLFRARRLEAALGISSHIYYKYEGVSPAGSHKLNTAVAQAYYNRREGVTRLTTETGAGQWGSALSLACRMFELQCKVYMVRVSYEQKPYRRSMMQTWGAEVVPSPSPHTEAGKAALAADPDSPGSLGVAISEAVEEAAGREDTKYSLGSVLNHVLLHQTIIGLEAEKQMAQAGETPDVLIGCVGGGSNFSGLAFPYIRRLLSGEQIRIVAVEPEACPTLTRGPYAYDFGDSACLTPLVPMFTLGHGFIPPRIHAGGLRYHGASPLLSHLIREGLVEAVALKQRQVFEGAITFARSEGIIVAPESAHAVRAAIDEAHRAEQEGRREVILFNLSGHGHFDMSAYDAFLDDKMEDFALPDAVLRASLETIEGLPKL